MVECMKGTYEISTESARFDLDLIHEFLTTTYWARGRPREVIERSIRNSLCFGAFDGAHQVGFARVITDRAVFGYLADVFVVPSHRRRGVAKQLMTAIIGHPDVSGLRVLLLRTRDAHGLYAQFGFNPLSDADEMMVRNGTVPL
jgi:GNAT superfamily N-acetyltransferase